MGANPILLAVEPNVTVLAFTIGVSALTGIAFGLAPAFGVTRVDLTHALKSVGRASLPRGGWATRHALVVGQIALCVLLVYGAGLLGRTLYGLGAKDGGFDRSNVLMFSVDASGTAFPAQDLPRFCDDLIERMRSGFGVLSGSCSTSVPVTTSGNARPLAVPGEPERPVGESLVLMNRISPDYLQAQGIELAEGRTFDTNDTDASERVVMISRSAARFFFGEANPIGRRVHFRGAEDRPMTVVGLVEDAIQWGDLRDDPVMTVYTPLTQLVEPESELTVSLRTPADPRELAGSVRAEVSALSPALVVDYIRTMDQQIDGSLSRERVLAFLSSAFALLAIVLCCVGLYGVIAYDVTRRKRDLGIRLALGGQRATVLGRVLGDAALVSGVGVVLGLAAALASTRNLANSPISELLFEIQPRDPLTLVLAVTLIVGTSLLASYLPARRASRIDPAIVMKAE
jgi:predicted permease